MPTAFLAVSPIPTSWDASVTAHSTAALMTLHQTPPTSDNLFHWSGDRTLLQGKSVQYVWTTFAEARASFGGAVRDSADAGTAMIGNSTTGEMQILVLLFIDRLFFDPAGAPYDDAFTRLLVAMAHETFGNVQTFLEMNVRTVPQRPAESMIVAAEIRAFEAGIAFIDRVALGITAKPLEPGGEKFLRDLWSARTREVSSLGTWTAQRK